MLQLSVSQAWAVLVLAGILEVIWATGMKATEGFTRLWPSISVTLVALASFYLLGLAMKTLPVGTAYAVWVGIGAAGVGVPGGHGQAVGRAFVCRHGGATNRGGHGLCRGAADGAVTAAHGQRPTR